MSKLDFLEISRNFKSYYQTLRDVHYYLTNDTELSPLELQAVSKVLSKLIYGFIRIKGTSFREMDRDQFEQEFNLFHQDFLNVIQNSGENNVDFDQFTELIDEVIGIAVKRTIALGKIKKVKQDSFLEDEVMADVTDDESELFNENEESVSDDEVVVDVIEEFDEITEPVPEVETVSTEVETVSAEGESVSAEVETVSAEVETVSAEVETVSAEVETVSAEVETVGAEVETVSAEVETVSAEVETFSSDLKSFDSNLKSFDSELKSFDSELKSLSSDFKTFSTDFKSFSPDVKTFSPDVKTFSNDFKTFSPKVETINTEVEAVLDDSGNPGDEKQVPENEVVVADVVNEVEAEVEAANVKPERVKNKFVDAAPIVNKYDDFESSDNFRFRLRRRKNR